MGPGISRNTKLLSIASFLSDISTGMIYPLFPFFLSNVLAAPAFVLGIMESLGGLSASISGVLSGFFSDRSGKRKNIIISGYALSAAVKLFLVFITSWPQMVLFRILERSGKGMREAPRDALIGQSEEKSRLGMAYGFKQLLDNFGAIIGPLLATILIAVMDGSGIPESAYREIFLYAAIPAFLATGVLFFIRDKGANPASVKPGASWFLKIPCIRQFLFVNAVFSLGQISILFFLLRANDFIPLVLVPVTYLAFNIFYTLSSLPAGMLSDKIGAKKSMIIGMMLFFAALAAFAFFPSTIVIFACFALLGFFMAIAKTAPQAFIAKAVENRHYASAIRAYNGLSGMIALPANLFAGFLYTVTILGTPATFLFPMVTTIIGMAALAFLVRE